MPVDITPLIPKGRRVIEGYGNGGFTVSSEKYSGSVIIFPDQVIGWRVKKWADFHQEELRSIISRKADIEILLIGCGNSMQFLDNSVSFELKQYGISVETMDTGAACRTYNILLAEGRDVVAALIAV